MNNLTHPVFSHQRKNHRNSVIANGPRIKEFRKQLGLTHEEFALDIDYSERLVRKAERGGRVDAKTLRVFLNFFQRNGIRTSIFQLSNDFDLMRNGKLIMIAWFERVFNQSDPSAFEDLMSERLTFSVNGRSGIGINLFREAIHNVFESMQPEKFVIDQIVTDGTWTAARWYAKATNSSRFDSPPTSIRIDGDIWSRTDDLKISEARWSYRCD